MTKYTYLEYHTYDYIDENGQHLALMPIDIDHIADSLLDGGYTPEDREEIKREYYANDTGDVDGLIDDIVKSMREAQ